jgi:catechol 2,3-dioxygenase-like lactoylglutathione lyase family enzyme
MGTLGEARIVTFIVKDLAATREFYVDQLGFRVHQEQPDSRNTGRPQEILTMRRNALISIRRLFFKPASFTGVALEYLGGL